MGYAEGKLPEETTTIGKHPGQRPSPLGIASRVDGETALAIKDEVPEANYHYRSRLSIVKRPESTDSAVGNIAVVAAGTPNLTVAKEVFLVAQALGNQTELDVDVGVGVGVGVA